MSMYEKVFKLKVKLPDGRVVFELSPVRASSQGVVLGYREVFIDKRTGAEVKNRCVVPPIKLDVVDAIDCRDCD